MAIVLSTENEENIIGFVDLFRCMRFGKNNSKITFFSQKLRAFCNIFDLH